MSHISHSYRQEIQIPVQFDHTPALAQSELHNTLIECDAVLNLSSSSFFRDIFAALIMKVYIDVFTGDELCSDSYPMKVVDDVYYEVEGKVRNLCLKK
jgi:hypothetical protein